MRYVLILLITFLFGCQKEEVSDIDPMSILNTKGWIIINYFVDGSHKTSSYITYSFEFIDNYAVNCADYMKGTSNCGTFSGFYEIKNQNDKLIFNMILPENCKLDVIKGEWIVVSMNNIKIHLIRTGNNQELVFKR